MNSLSDCIFCRIVNKQEPAHIVYEDGNTVAFLDHLPLNEWHILVVPKEHIKDFVDADMKVWLDVMKTAKRITDALHAKREFAANIVTSKWKKAWQEVWHLHVHIIPRTRTDMDPRKDIDQVAKFSLANIATHLRAILVKLPDNQVAQQ